MGLLVLYLAPLVLIIAGFGMLGGKSVVMGSPPGLERVPLEFSWISSCSDSNILLGRTLLHLEPGHYFYEPVAETLYPRVTPQSTATFGKHSRGFLREVRHGS